MKKRMLGYSFALLFLVGVGITIAADGVQRKYSSSDKEFYLSEADLAFIRPGIQLKIQKVEVSGSDVSATFRIADDQDQPLDRLGIETPGTVSTSWILARIQPDDTQYTAYTTRTQTSPITGVSAIQPSTDSGGSYTSLGNGVYKYTFGFKLPADDPADATHTVGVYAVRDLRQIAEELGLFQLVKTGRYVSNATSNFLPSGGEVTVVRDVARPEACNQGHNTLAPHGGSRQITQLCILCHQPQNIDPDTGNTPDFKVMIHKIHRGADLPSVQAGTPYQIIGFRQSVHDYSEVEWPQDVRNCTTCHQGGTQSDNYKTNPNRVACGSCHDDVNFATGEHHPGGVQADDSKCSICHPADTGLEFDLSVTGVHTIPGFSKQLAGLNVEILEVTNTNPGDKPAVSFSIKNDEGDPVDISTLSNFQLVLAGPTSDFTFATLESAQETATAGAHRDTYTFETALPDDASGSYAVGTIAYRNVTIPGPLLGQSFEPRETAMGTVHYFGISGSEAVPRRKVVDNQNCNVCHKNLITHHGQRRNTEFCVLCHNPAMTDGASTLGHGRPHDAYPPQTINFRTMVHRIHSGHDLENDFTIYHGSRPVNFNEVHFPGDRRDCETCHVNDSYELPLPAGLANGANPRGFYEPWGPAASACLGCHDSQSTAAHAFLQTSPFGESCATCHGEGKEFAVSRVHAR